MISAVRPLTLTFVAASLATAGASVAYGLSGSTVSRNFEPPIISQSSQFYILLMDYSYAKNDRSAVAPAVMHRNAVSKLSPIVTYAGLLSATSFVAIVAATIGTFIPGLEQISKDVGLAALVACGGSAYVAASFAQREVR